jgi:serpin B
MQVIHRCLALSLFCTGIMAATLAQAQDAPTYGDIATPTIIDHNAQRAVEGVNAFSLDLYKRLVMPGQNLFLSPSSVSVAVGLAYRGAVGKTADELNRTLHFGAPPADYIRSDGQLLAAMNFSGAGRQLHTANAVWVQSGMPLQVDFEADVARYAKAGFQRVDFAVDPDSARRTINRWAEDATHEKIKDLLHEGDLTSKTAAVLVNAIYWKGKWTQPFDSAATKPGPFTLVGGRKVTTSLMHLDYQEFHVIEREGIKAISLPYQGGEISMVVLLPGTRTDLDQFEQKLTWPELRRWIFDLKDAREQQTLLTLPKLHLDWRRDLASDIAEMGAPFAFSDNADFSGIAKLPYPGGNPLATNLKITHIFHQTTIDVEEKDTEAAAATAVVIEEIMVTSAKKGKPAPPPFVFRADHPFLFALVDSRTDMILFMGRYVTPTAAPVEP